MTPLNGHYDIYAVLLSCLIAAASSYSALTLVNRNSHRPRSHAAVWLAAAAVMMGLGIWSMHFVGMHAHRLDIPVRYAIMPTTLSLLTAIASCLAAFRISYSNKQSWLRKAGSGLSMAFGITAMHYIGIDAIEHPMEVRHDPAYVALSVLIALAASFTALFLFNKECRNPGFTARKAACAAILGAAVCGVHYSALAGARFYIASNAAMPAADVHDRFGLYAAVAAGIFLVIGATWFVLVVDQKVLQRLAYSDMLTGLPNRHRLAHHFDHSFAFYREGFVLFIDFDRFKTINDALGHDAGDRFLRDAADRLSGALESGQMLFRFGGDEFIVAAEGGRGAAEASAERVLGAMRQPFLVDNAEYHVGASIGISLLPEHGKERNTLIRAADMAMYDAKAAGRNRYVVFHETSGEKALRRLELEKGLRKAMQLDEFIVHYQPKWDASAGRLTGIEALLRWEHGKLGPISPAEFIPVAEDTGLIIGITRWVLREACRQNRLFQSQGFPKVCVSVNMSLRVFESGTLIDMVAEALAFSGMDPADLEIEITETIAMRDVEGTIAQLQAVKALGVRVSMDDFGTGYSSLGTLDRIPIDTLKIDQQFVRQSDVPSKQAIISTIIAMASHLQLDIVAEGVETPEQSAFLQSRGCRVMQGYYYGRPMNAAALQEWARAC